MAKITVNGKTQGIEDNTTLAGLLVSNNISQPDMVSIQLNEEFILKDDYASIILKDGDTVDFLYFMGGGQ
ncbi:MAG: sulfur carrier protein ThiS [Dysgonamonadaceae bacterium]|jgi:sulfur carrier protein|nr:sulfur carrier protein ThiS [Dysgonamonadaceae bacterium]